MGTVPVPAVHLIMKKSVMKKFNPVSCLSEKYLKGKKLKTLLNYK